MNGARNAPFRERSLKWASWGVCLWRTKVFRSVMKIRTQKEYSIPGSISNEDSIFRIKNTALPEDQALLLLVRLAQPLAMPSQMTVFGRFVLDKPLAEATGRSSSNFLILSCGSEFGLVRNCLKF